MELNDLITERHRLILSYTAENNYSSKLFEGLDIDTESTYILRALSFLASKNEWKDIPKNIEVRLRGMMRCYHIKYQTEFSYAVRLFTLWNLNSIRYFVFRNTALKLGGYTEDCVPVGDISVFVTAADRKKAIELALQSGFSENRKIAGFFTKDTCGILICDDRECFAGDDPEKILNVAESVCVRYQHNQNIDIPIPSPDNLFKLCIHQIIGSFCNSLDINELFYLMWIGTVIKNRAKADYLTIPDISDSVKKPIKIGIALKSSANRSNGLKLFFIKAVKKITKMYLLHLFKKGRLFIQ